MDEIVLQPTPPSVRQRASYSRSDLTEGSISHTSCSFTDACILGPDYYSSYTLCNRATTDSSLSACISMMKINNVICSLQLRNRSNWNGTGDTDEAVNRKPTPDITTSRNMFVNELLSIGNYHADHVLLAKNAEGRSRISSLNPLIKKLELPLCSTHAGEVSRADHTTGSTNTIGSTFTSNGAVHPRSKRPSSAVVPSQSKGTISGATMGLPRPHTAHEARGTSTSRSNIPTTAGSEQSNIRHRIRSANSARTYVTERLTAIRQQSLHTPEEEGNIPCILRHSTRKSFVRSALNKAEVRNSLPNALRRDVQCVQERRKQLLELDCLRRKKLLMRRDPKWIAAQRKLELWITILVHALFQPHLTRQYQRLRSLQVQRQMECMYLDSLKLGKAKRRIHAWKRKILNVFHVISVWRVIHTKFTVMPVLIKALRSLGHTQYALLGFRRYVGRVRYGQRIIRDFFRRRRLRIMWGLMRWYELEKKLIHARNVHASVTKLAPKVARPGTTAATDGVTQQSQNVLVAALERIACPSTIKIQILTEFLHQPFYSTPITSLKSDHGRFTSTRRRKTVFLVRQPVFISSAVIESLILKGRELFFQNEKANVRANKYANSAAISQAAEPAPIGTHLRVDTLRAAIERQVILSIEAERKLWSQNPELLTATTGAYRLYLDMDN